MKRRAGRAGFTLIELLAVMCVMAILLGMALPMANRVGRAPRTEGTVQQLRSALALARQTALATAGSVSFAFDPTPPLRGGTAYWITDSGGRLLAPTNSLPSGMVLLNVPQSLDAEVTFKGDGALACADVVRRLELRQNKGLDFSAPLATITVHRATGYISTE